MATELRRIYLSTTELRDAAHSYLRVHIEIVGSVTVVAAQARKDGTLSARFVHQAQPDKPKGEIVLQGDQVVELLVRFCLENNIPLPRKGRKSIVVTPDVVALQIKVGELETVTAT